MVLVNGVETSRISVFDRGLAYGDGVFETVYVRDGSPCLWREHVERLQRGADRLGMPCPLSPLLWDECIRVAETGRRCVVKIVLTRGEGGRGYQPPATPRPTRILLRYPDPDYPADWRKAGVAVTVCRTRLGENRALAGIKHLNRLEQVLARRELDDPDIAEGLMCNEHEQVIGGTMSNLFVLVRDRLLTPRVNRCGVAGTVRARVAELAAAVGLEVREADIPRSDLATADGLFLTNALIGAWPVRRLDSARLDVDRLPGGLLNRICEAAFGLDDRGDG